MSPRDLEGKYRLALEQIGDKDSSTSDRHKPIYRRESHNTQKQAIDDAARALSALWKVRTAHSH
jgi:hypothetical protein